MDVVFIVNGLDGGRNLNVGRIERYLDLTWSGGALPVIILNKVDLCLDISACLQDGYAGALGVPIYPVSATERIGIDALRKHLARGQPAAFLGPSGVGKSGSPRVRSTIFFPSFFNFATSSPACIEAEGLSEFTFSDKNPAASISFHPT